MPHIHAGPGEIDHTVSAYIIREDLDQPRLLLHMHRKHQRLLPVGGHIETSETIWGALSHEVAEESGYDFSSLQVLQPKLRFQPKAKGEVLQPVPFYINTHDVTDDGGHFHLDLSYVFVTNSPPQAMPDESESQDLRWMSVVDLETCSPDDIYEGARLSCIAALTKFYPAWEPVPTTDFSTQKAS